MREEITMKDVAMNLGISIATVSRALRNDPKIKKSTRILVLNESKRLGYRTNCFAQNLRKKTSNIVGIIVPRLDSHFMSLAIFGIVSELNKEGYNAIICQSLESYEHEVKIVNLMLENRVAGLLVSLANDSSDNAHFDQIIKNKIPIVFFDRIVEYKNVVGIEIDNESASYNITNHLIQQNYKEIMFVSARPFQKLYKDRLEGFNRALVENKIILKSELLVISELSFEAGETIAVHVINSKRRPEAIIFTNDICAAGCLAKLMNAGIKVPEDIAVTGFNNDPICRAVRPNLTTIKYDGKELGMITAQTLIKSLKDYENHYKIKKILLKSELIIRASSQMTK